MIKKENKVMNYETLTPCCTDDVCKCGDFINLESVGSTVTNEGIVFPQLCDETPETSSDFDEMSGVYVMDTCDEWWTSMSCEDAVSLFRFLAETDVYDTEGYIPWAVSMGELVEEANECSLSGYTIYGKLEDMSGFEGTWEQLENI